MAAFAPAHPADSPVRICGEPIGLGHNPGHDFFWLDDPRGLAWSLEVFAGLAAAGGDGQAATRLWGASNALLDRVGGSLVPTIGWIRDCHYQSTREALGDGVFASALAEGRTMSASQAIALAGLTSDRSGEL